MRRIHFFGMLLLVFMLLFAVDSEAFAATAPGDRADPQTSYTRWITADLDFSGNDAICSGEIRLYGTYDVSITVTLYQKIGSARKYITSWSGSANSGLPATAGGSALVAETGVFQVVVRGNVSGLEYPSTSITKTK